MEKERFEIIVERLWNDIPEHIRKRIDNLTVDIQDVPNERQKDIMRNRGAKKYLGYFRGTPLGNRSIRTRLRFPDQIVLFRNEIESSCSTESEIEHKIEEVLFREIGHYFGMNDRQIHQMLHRS